MSTQDTYQRTLIEACHIAGNERVLAVRLNQPMNKVIGWLLGDAAIPTDVFLKAVDMIVSTNVEHVGDWRPFLAALRNRHSH